MSVIPAGMAAVNIVQTNVFGEIAHHWQCTVPGCGRSSARRSGREDQPHGQIVAGAQRHAATHTDAQEEIDAAR